MEYKSAIERFSKGDALRRSIDDAPTEAARAAATGKPPLMAQGRAASA